ncbi:hypothetical protein BDP81DRAFT_88583 [Colletotrichum phormii]|uniref:Uncharacterized protein n=1 Tax=Colletotrichum phormii TaxID=359342 RepID=A0AAJ0A1L0_9PEZI|nr:uncharacterized protein BDP81DRAFT_88583 [Colletotrichum phormii]KAK1654785.1 hypothetical protein BDP81DRAFT_88583 [Colletotrichum phormii]
MRQSHRGGSVLGHDPGLGRREAKNANARCNAEPRQKSSMDLREARHACQRECRRIALQYLCAFLKFSHRNPRVILHPGARGTPRKKKRPAKSNEETMDERQHRHTHTHIHASRHVRNSAQVALTAAISGSLARQPRTGIRSIVHTVPIWRRPTRRTARANVSANKTPTALNQSWLGQKGVPRS